MWSVRLLGVPTKISLETTNGLQALVQFWPIVRQFDFSLVMAGLREVTQREVLSGFRHFCV